MEEIKIYDDGNRSHTVVAASSKYHSLGEKAREAQGGSILEGIGGRKLDYTEEALGRREEGHGRLRMWSKCGNVVPLVNGMRQGKGDQGEEMPKGSSETSNAGAVGSAVLQIGARATKAGSEGAEENMVGTCGGIQGNAGKWRYIH